MEREHPAEVSKKDIAKAYEAYTKPFTPKPTYLKNCLKAFLTGGAICTVAFYVNNRLLDMGMKEDAAGNLVTIGIIVLAQFLTGLGVFDCIATATGAGIIVPISGFANSMVAPAMEYRKEGPVLGSGAKMFTVTGPVLVCGITAATVVGVVYWIIGLF